MPDYPWVTGETFVAADANVIYELAALAKSTADATTIVANAAVPKALYDANSILIATTDNTPAVLAMGASTIVARLASGGIVAATPAQLRTLLALANPLTITTQAGTTYTPVIGDAYTEIEMTSGSAVTFTVPANVFAAGDWFNVRQQGAGQITFAQGASLSLRTPGGAKSAAQWATATVVFRSATEAILDGRVTV